MNKYFVELEFEFSGNIYWFPVIINSKSDEDALKIKTAVESSIKDVYNLRRSSNPERIYNEINSKFIGDYIKTRMKGKIFLLDANVWKFKNIPNLPELNFSTQMDLCVDSITEYIDDSVANLIARHRFPVKQIFSQYGYEDFLLINIIQPD